jgi:hypothetical protein
VAEINRAYDERQQEVSGSCAEQENQVKALHRYLVPVAPQSHYVPVNSVSSRFYSELELCQQLPDPEAECMPPLRQRYYQELGRTYFKADLDAVFALVDQDPQLNLEALLAHSHNSRLLGYMEESEADLKQFCQDLHARWEELRQAELAQSAEQQTFEEAEERRRVALAVAAGLQAFGQGLQQAGSYNSQGTPAQRGCTNDYQCGPGRTCLKDNYATSGVCLQKVKPSGVPDYRPTPGGNVGVKVPQSTDCMSGLDCPVGFQCHQSSGACVR